ncbi:MAG: O-antigen ligase family protein, partial [Methylophilaceae bacterium]
MHEKLAGLAGPLQGAYAWRDMLAKSALFLFGIALWYRGLGLNAAILLVVFAWILDGGLRRFVLMIKEPLVLAILVFCAVLLLGILWSDDLGSGFRVWRRYAILLVFIPYLALLNKQRLPWAISGLLIGYSGVLLTGVYHWIVLGEPGIPTFVMSQTGFSAMLGVGAILALYLANTSNSKKVKPLLWFLASLFLFMQFNQGARGTLLATLLALLLLIFMLYGTRIKTLLGVMAAMFIMVMVFAYGSNGFQERLVQGRSDIELSQQGKYASSLGYRLAMWDVGLHGIAQHPWFGHGTGMPSRYFDETIATYKNGIYKDLPDSYVKTYHYHNDWIEIGMQIGALGLLAYTFFLWSWFRTLRAHRLAALGAALVCFVFISGLVETLVFFRQTLYFLLVITAIAIVWQKGNGDVV